MTSILFVLGLTLPTSPYMSETPHEVREGIVYATVDERDLLLDAYVPSVTAPAPAVLVVHGGAWRSGNRRQLKAYAAALAGRGMVCFAIDYRLAPQHKFPAQIEDCRAAVRWIREHANEFNVDPTRLGAMGYSAGGHLVSLLGVTGAAASEANGNLSTRLQAVAAGGAPTDFRWFPDNGDWAEYLMGGNLETAPERFRNASAAAFVDEDDPPFFFFNGDADKLVPLAWTMSCHTALEQAGVPTEMYVVSGADHMQAARDQEALERAYRFPGDSVECRESDIRKRNPSLTTQNCVPADRNSLHEEQSHARNLSPFFHGFRHQTITRSPDGSQLDAPVTGRQQPGSPCSRTHWLRRPFEKPRRRLHRKR